MPLIETTYEHDDEFETSITDAHTRKNGGERAWKRGVSPDAIESLTLKKPKRWDCGECPFG